MNNYSTTQHKIKTLWNEAFSENDKKISYNEVLSILTEYLDDYSSPKLSFVEKRYEIDFIPKKEDLYFLKVSDKNGSKINLLSYTNGNFLVEVLPLQVGEDFVWWLDELGNFCYYSSNPSFGRMKIQILIFNIY